MTNRKRKKSEKEEKKPELEDLLTPPEGAKEVSFEDAALNLINLINFDLNYFRTDLQLLLRLLLKKDNLKLYNYKAVSYTHLTLPTN